MTQILWPLARTLQLWSFSWSDRIWKDADLCKVSPLTISPKTKLWGQNFFSQSSEAGFTGIYGHRGGKVFFWFWNNQDSFQSCLSEQTEQFGGKSSRWETQWSLWLISRDPVCRWEKVPEGQPWLHLSTNLSLMAGCPDGSLCSVKDTWKVAWTL